MLSSFMIFILATLGCALVQTWAGFLILRLVCGMFGSAPIAIAMGIFADIYESTVTRGRAMSAFMAVGVFRAPCSSSSRG